MQHRRSEEHTSELRSRQYLVCRLLLEKTKRQFPPSPRANDNLHTGWTELTHSARRELPVARSRSHSNRPQTHRHNHSFFNDARTTEIYTLSLHDALPI